MADPLYAEADDWTPSDGFDGLPIPGLPPSAQPGMQQRAPALLPAHGTQRPVDRPAVERTPQNLSFDPEAIASMEPHFGPALGADAPTTPVVAPENGHSLGLALLLVTVGAGVGLKMGGTMGGVSGGLFGGAAVNAFRAARCVTQGTKDADKEALVSGTWAIVAAALGGYLAYQEHKKASPALAKRNKSEEPEEPEEDEPDEPEGDDEPEEEPEDEK
jgi:hypothetical protein